MDINKVILLGRVGKDPEFFKTIKGEEGARLRLATNASSWDSDRNQYTTNTTWHEVTVYSEWFIKTIKDRVIKGTGLYIEGSIRHNEYIGKDGSKKHSTQILVSQSDGRLRIAEQPQKNILHEPVQTESKAMIDKSYDGNFMTDEFVDDGLPF